jgi:hypothetical protein
MTVQILPVVAFGFGKTNYSNYHRLGINIYHRFTVDDMPTYYRILLKSNIIIPRTFGTLPKGINVSIHNNV